MQVTASRDLKSEATLTNTHTQKHTKTRKKSERWSCKVSHLAAVGSAARTAQKSKRTSAKIIEAPGAIPADCTFIRADEGKRKAASKSTA